MSERWLSYSGWHVYDTCPKRFEHEKVKKDPRPLESKHNALVGSVVQRVFETFYNDEVWRKGKEVSSILQELTEQYFYEYLDTTFVDFNHNQSKFTQKGALDACQLMVPKVLSAIKRERLLGPYSRSEVVLRVPMGGGFFIYGQIDFLIRNASGEIFLIDGKASDKRDKNIDFDQLTFYAMAFLLQYDQLPDKVGIMYYHFADDPELAFDWIPVDMEKVELLRKRVLKAFEDISNQKFKATPSATVCRYCPWESTCPENRKQQIVRAEKKRWAQIERGEEVLPEATEAFVGFGGITRKVTNN